MAFFTETVTCSRSGSNYTGNVWGQSFKQIDIPSQYSINNVPLQWTYVRTNNSGGGTLYCGLTYKTDKITSEQIITTALSSETRTFQLQLADATILKLRIYAYVYLNNVGYTYKQCQASFWLPFGGIESENIITAAKLNEVATRNNVSASVTTGSLITSSPWQTVGNSQNITFNTIKPLKNDLEALLYKTKGTWTNLSTW